MLPIASSTVAKFTSAFYFLEFLFFVAGVSNGIKERWAHHTTDGSILLVVIVVSGIVLRIVLISLVTYLGECKHFGEVLSHLWMGVLFSVLSFTEIAFDHPIDSLQDLDFTDILVIMSTGFHVLKTLTVRICGTASYESNFLSTEECMYLVGFLCTTGTMDFASMLTITVAVTVHLMAFHLKSSVTLLSACSLFFLGSVYFFSAIDVHYNPYILSCFIVHLFFESVIDIYFSRLSLLGTWKKFIFYGCLAHRLQILAILVLEVLFYGSSMQLLYEPERPVYRKLIFILMSIYWALIHIMFILTCWGFVGKLEECSNIADSTGNFSDNAMSHIMASKGVRHFCLVLINVTFCTIISTVIAIASSWQEKIHASSGCCLLFFL